MLDASLGALVSSTVFAEDTVNATPQSLDTNVSVTGTTTDFDGESLTLSTTGGAEDQLTLTNEGGGAGQIGVSGLNVTYEGTVIGSISSDGSNGSNFTVDLNNNASKAAIERLIENINYQNTSDAPTTSRTITVALSNYFSEDVTVTIVAQNDALTLTANSPLNSSEGATTTITTAELNITDPDDAATDIVFSVQTAPVNGQIELTTNAGVAVASFTLDDLNNNRVVYVHNDSDTISDSFDFTVTDGDETLALETFNITVSSVNDPLSVSTNTGTTVFQNFSTSIGGDLEQFGTELLRYNSTGTYGTWNGTVDNKNLQFRLVFTTPGATPADAPPGQVLFESGGAGVGLGLYLNDNMQLDFYSGAAAATPRLSSDTLATGTQYSVVVEIDQTADEIRLHYVQDSGHDWFSFGRTAEKTLTGYTTTDHSGSDGAGIGRASSASGQGGYNGVNSGQLGTFQGTIDSDLVITRFPTASGTANTDLVAIDSDTPTSQIIYTITDDVDNGTLYNNGVALGLNDTFTQADLDLGRITYTNTGGVAESFGFSVSDGTTTIAGQTFTITIDTSNTAPEILHTTTILDENFEGGTSGWNNNTTNDLGNDLTEFWGQFNRNINVSGNQELYQTFATSGTQDYIVVEFDFYRFDSWDNEYFYAFVDDTQVLNNHRFNSGYNQEANGVTGNVTYRVQETTNSTGLISGTGGSTDQTIHYTMIIDTSDPTFKLGFGSSLNSNSLTDETFGIDNLKITEVSRGGAGNQEFSLAENASNGDLVGTVQAVEDNAGQSIAYSITGGTGNGLFAIDASTGEITVTDNSGFDFEATTSYTLDVLVSDGFLTDTQTITINMVDVLENTRPTINGTTFSISEAAANNDDVGTVTSTDPEGDGVTYRIISGNTGNAFKIDAATGLIEVNNATQLDFDKQSSYAIRIRATDDNTFGLYHDRTLTINLIDVDEAPSLDIETVIETQNTNVFYNASNGNFYMVETTNFSWDNAVTNAQSELLNGVAGHLVTITTQAEYEFVRDYVSPSHVWIALSDAGEEGKWIWTTGPEAGTQISQGNTDAIGWYNRWTGSEPNSGSTRNWALMHSNGWWYDNWPNTNGYDSVVEWEGEDIINNSYYRVNHSNADASDVTNGTSVGVVQGVDPEGDGLVYSIEGGNADGIFAIDANTGEITILDNTNLDATVTDTYTLTIRATEASGVKFDEIDITVKFNDDFSISTNTPLNVNEASSAVLTTANLNITDIDGVAADTVFRVTTLPMNGQLEHSTNPGFQISSFTLDDVQNGRISFVHDGTETATDSFIFSVTDGGRDSTDNTFNITIGAINDAPTMTTNTGATITEGGNTTITNLMLDSTDLDDTAAELTYTASNYILGHIEVSGVTQNTFTQDDIDNNRVVFVHNGNEGGTARFDFSLADGGENGAAPATGQFNLTVTAVNDAPLITTNTGATMLEGANLTITTAMLNTTDPDDSGANLTYTLSNILNGRLELSTSPGVPIISFTQADLAANRVVFIHDGGESDAQFDVSVADGGEDGATADTATFNITRTPVNDSPLIGVNAGSSINQNSIVIIKNSVLRANDPDDSGVGLTYTVTGTTNGQVEFVANPNVAINSFTQDDIDNSRILFRHSGPPGVADFDFTLSDGGEDGAVAANGTFNLTVDNVNDAPNITTNAGPTVAEGSTTTITTAMLDSFDPDDFGADLTWTVSNLSNGVVQVSGVTQNTFTQADLDAGLVTFIHDGSETLNGGFDIQVADGGEDGALPDTDTFSITVTPVNEGPTLVVNDGSPNDVNFNDYPIQTFDPSQDGASGSTSATVSPDGSTLEIGTNSWKRVLIPYTLTANTVLSLDFRADEVSEILGIGFDNDNSIGGGINGYQLGGTQVWSGMDQSYRTYSPGDGWVRYDIPIGADYTGAVSELVFVLDDDASPTGTALFRNVNFYESDQTVSMNEGGSFSITNAHINSTDPDDSGTGLTFTASNLSNGHIEVSGISQNTFTQDDIDNNRVAFIHDGSDSSLAGFDISLADGGEDGAVADTGSFTIIVNAQNDAPTIATNTGATMNEGANLTITTAMLNEGDSDDDGAELTYTASNLSNGHIEVSGVTRTTFTQDDIDKGRVVFVHDDSQTINASFDISLADGGENGSVAAAGTFNITVTPVNDAPSLVTNTGATVIEGQTVAITTAQLNGTDVDDSGVGLVYTASNISNGQLELTTAPNVAITSFTQDDLDNNRVVFRHDDSQTTTAGFDISLADGGEDGAVAATGSFALSVTPVNDAPTVAVNTGATMDEGVNLTITTAMLNEGDLDDSGTGLTYTASNLTNGHLEVGGVIQNTFTQDDIDNNRVVFIHDGSETVAADFDFSLADGGEDTAAAALGVFDITITPVNDTPVITTNLGDTLLEGGSLALSNAVLASSDADNADAGLVYTITSLSAGQIHNTNTVTALGIGSTFTQSDIDNGFILYTHDGGEVLAATLGFTVGDGTATSAAQTFTWALTPVNDAPTDITLSSDVVLENSALGTVIGTLDTIDVDQPGDNFTYTILNNPGNLFDIQNGHLVVAGAIDFESAPLHQITVRSDDGNGGIVDVDLSITVQDVRENRLIAQQDASRPIPVFEGFAIEEERTIPEAAEPSLIRASLSRNQFAQIHAFYGDEGISQTLRENTTLEIQEITKAQRVLFDSTPDNVEPESQTGATDDFEHLDQRSDRFTNIREMLKHLQEFSDDRGAGDTAEDGERDETGGSDGFQTLYSQFEDVLSYHEQRKDHIRLALLSDGENATPQKSEKNLLL